MIIYSVATFRKYKLPMTHIIPFPKRNEPSSVPDFPPGRHVLAVYPGTTALYKATVVSTPRKVNIPPIHFDAFIPKVQLLYLAYGFYSSVVLLLFEYIFGGADIKLTTILMLHAVGCGQSFYMFSEEDRGVSKFMFVFHPYSYRYWKVRCMDNRWK